MAIDSRKAEQIWHTVRLVPYGRVAGYGFIADLAGLPGRARLVGRVLQLTPPDRPVPWYRILRSNGQIAFAPGSTPAREQAGLLQQEGVVVLNNRVSMQRFAWKPELGELMQLDY